jgi:propanediol dehydratase small subunit
MARTDNGIKMRETRAKNTETLRTVAEQELKRLQTLNETVKKEQELSATRLKMKLETTQKQMTLEYVAGRTVLFNEFKKAAAVTANMQENTATIVEELRNKYESTRDLERQLAKI